MRREGLYGVVFYGRGFAAGISAHCISAFMAIEIIDGRAYIYTSSSFAI